MLSVDLRSLFRFLKVIAVVAAILAVLTSLCITSVTTGFWGWPYHGLRTNYVKRELAETVEGLPQFEQLNLLATKQWNSSSHRQVPKKFQRELSREGVPPCYFAGTYFIYGTELLVQEVIELYSQELQPLGWHFVSEYKRFLRGDNESIYITEVTHWTPAYHPVGFDYDEMSRLYETIIVVEAEYTWPTENGC